MLLAAAFAAVPLRRVGAAARDRRFAAALALTQLALLPALAWLLTRPLAGDPALVLGALLVLLAPCTDWFVPFARAAGGDGARALAATPALLLAQMASVPLYLLLFVGRDAAEAVSARPFLAALGGLVLLPLALAAGAQAWAARRPAGRAVLAGARAVADPALCAVLFLVAASQVEAVRDAGADIGAAAAVFAAFLLAAALAGALAARLARLGPAAARTLVVSAATRNSLVVLPLALALPAGAALAAAAVVTQTLVELTGMALLVRLLPRLPRARPRPG